MTGIVNVKDYGAVGNGSIDDGAALLAAITAAYGSFTSPNGDVRAGYIGPYVNKVVYFPAGHYIITSPLQLPATMGGHLLGAGSDAVRIENVTPGSTVINTDGWTYGVVEGLTFKGIDGGTAVGFDWKGSAT